MEGRTETQQNEAACYIISRLTVLKLTSWLKTVFAVRGGSTIWKREIKQNEFNVTGRSWQRRERIRGNGDARIGRRLGSAPGRI